MIRKEAETEVPMMPPILLKAPNLVEMAEAVAATMREVMMTMLGSVRGIRKKLFCSFALLGMKEDGDRGGSLQLTLNGLGRRMCLR